MSDTVEEPLSECGKHIGAHCGDEVIGRLKSGNETVISTSCCYKLLQTGYPCHTKLTLFILENNAELKNANWTEFFAKSDKIYHKCDALTAPGNSEFLANCTESLGPDCGEEVYNKLILDKTISKHCCEKLVKTGEQCHAAMAKALIRIPEMRNVNAIQLLKKNRKIFEHCLHVK
ncbi:unnamed protein product [Sphenostylis stenocarpa]|uniref:Prolamin-like domain-containing protein n=1 Tax=Sphenostylis stenocarpa TaxID=92480 RepID=A0AA87BCT7_9FABA|nr:unnamed protein product [Sphenostylis stenocarpa]